MSGRTSRSRGEVSRAVPRVGCGRLVELQVVFVHPAILAHGGRDFVPFGCPSVLAGEQLDDFVAIEQHLHRFAPLVEAIPHASFGPVAGDARQSVAPDGDRLGGDPTKAAERRTDAAPAVGVVRGDLHAVASAQNVGGVVARPGSAAHMNVIGVDRGGFGRVAGAGRICDECRAGGDEGEQYDSRGVRGRVARAQKFRAALRCLRAVRSDQHFRLVRIDEGSNSKTNGASAKISRLRWGDHGPVASTPERRDAHDGRGVDSATLRRVQDQSSWLASRSMQPPTIVRL